MRILSKLILLLMPLVLSAAAQAGQSYLVSESAAGNIWRLEDTNGDGDALDIGERTLWGNGFSGVAGLEIFAGAVYAVEEGLGVGNNEIVRLFDANGDGDALDVGERTVWAAGLDQPADITRDAAGRFYVSEGGKGEVWKLSDANGDGDALDVGERTLFADAIGKPQVLLPWSGGLLVSSSSSGEVVLLDDANGDGDALDSAEQLAILSGANEARGLLRSPGGGFYVSSFDDDAVYQATDNNGDGDFLDVAEVLGYADTVYGSLNGPGNMAGFPTGGFLLADTDDDEVLWVRDTNGDGDALDLGEVVTFADGIGSPADIVPLLTGLPGDYNGDGKVGPGDYTVWRNSLGDTGVGLAADGTGDDLLGFPDGDVDEFDYDFWKLHYGESIPGSGSALVDGSASVPEPSSLVLFLIACAFLAVREVRQIAGSALL